MFGGTSGIYLIGFLLNKFSVSMYKLVGSNFLYMVTAIKNLYFSTMITKVVRYSAVSVGVCTLFGTY